MGQLSITLISSPLGAPTAIKPKNGRQETTLISKSWPKSNCLEIKSKLEAGLEEARILLLPKDEVDDRPVMMEFRAGTGGDEAAIFAGDLYRMYQRHCEGKGWSWELVNANEGTAGGFKEITVRVEGEGVYGWLKYESGVHRVQRVPWKQSPKDAYIPVRRPWRSCR